MNKRTTIWILAFPVFFSVFFQSLYSQTTNGVVLSHSTRNGITVAHTTDFGAYKGKDIRSYGRFTPEKNFVHRVFTNEINKTFFGYDLQVVPLSNKTKFKLMIKPLSIKPPDRPINEPKLTFLPLPKNPGEIIVNDGDTLVLDIFENSETKERISDLIIVTRKTSVGNLFAHLELPKDFSLDDVNLKLRKAKFIVNGTEIGKTGGSSGSNIYFYIPKKGRFVISPFPRKGFKFQKIATALNNKIVFSYGKDKYEITSDVPVLGEGGKWNLWVMFDKNFVPNKRLNPKDTFMVGSGDIKGIFHKP